MRIHREGRITLTYLIGFTALLTFTFWRFGWTIWPFFLGLMVLLILFMVWFFREPKRALPSVAKNDILCPCDGRVVVIEPTTEAEYFKDERIQISIFMSPLNVHINWAPISGIVSYFKYHSGKYLVAWHPKSSTDNERATTVIKNQKNQEVLMRQIAGAVARRIVSYSKYIVNEPTHIGDQIGFIKFGSRVDLYLPQGSEILVQLEQKVVGKETIIAKLPA